MANSIRREVVAVSMIGPAEPFLAPFDPETIGVMMLPKFGRFSTSKGCVANLETGLKRP
jgi:hypothetical protein